MANGMELGELLVHLLGGAGMEYAARSRFSQSAEEQAKQNNLTRLQEQLLQRNRITSEEGMQLTGIGAQKDASGVSNLHDLELQGNQFGQDIILQGNQLTQDTRERGLDRTSAEGMARAGNDTTKWVAQLHADVTGAGNRLRASTSRYATDKSSEDTRYSANKGFEGMQYQVDKQDNYQRWSETLRSTLAGQQMEAMWAGMNDKLDGSTIATMINDQRSALNALLQTGYEATPEEASEAMKEVEEAFAPILNALDLDFSLPGGSEKDMIYSTYRMEFDKQLGQMPENEPELFERMLIGIYQEVEARGLGKSHWTEALYKARFDISIQEGIKTARETDSKKIADKGGKPGFFEGMSPAAHIVAPLALGIRGPAAAMDWFTGRGDNAERQLEIFKAAKEGYSPAAFLAAERMAAREGGTRTAMDILHQEFMPGWGGTKKSTALPDTNKILDMPTGAPGLE